MAEYIDREALLEAISKIGGSPLSEWDTVGVVSLVANQPATDVAPVRRGHWKRDRENRPICSECAEEPYRNGDYNLPNYCPNCGAKLRYKMVDMEKKKEELRVILAELERDIKMLQANISKLRADMDAVNEETDLAAFDEAHDLERGLKHIELY